MTGDKRRPFAVFDIDGTLIRWQLYHAIVDELVERGCINKKAFQKVEDARNTWRSRKHIASFGEYEMMLVRVYNSALRSIPVETYLKAVDSVFEAYKDQVYAYSRDLIRSLKERGYVLLAISGSHQEVIEKLADYYGFDDAVGAEFGQKDGHFTKQTRMVYGHKSEILDELIKRHNLTVKGSVAIGDSATDADILARVEQPIAFNPTKELFATAKENGWKIVLERKNVIYELEKKNGRYILAQTDH
jgi:HAD superfamily hydrolase (TIGR01490 family)